MISKGTVMELAVDSIEYDKSNPRIAKFIEMYGDNIAAESIALALGVGDAQLDSSGTSFQSLKASIKTNGGIIHPIIVNRTDKDKYMAIEGNTRLAIYKEFKENKVDGNWDTITAIVYDSLSKQEIDAIRLQSHLVGPRPWDPYSKAKYLNLLRNSEHLTINQIIDFCGGKKDEVIDLIDAYLDMEKYYRPLLENEEDFDTTRFSTFVELQRSRIKTALLESNYTKTDFAKWVIEMKFYPSQTIRRLPEILRNPKSKEIFLKNKKGAAEMAWTAIQAPTEDLSMKSASLFQIARVLVNKIFELKYVDVMKLKEQQPSEDVQALFDAKDQINELCNDIVAKED